MPAALEHISITVADPSRVARTLRDLFDWEIRWEGRAIHGGRAVHVGAGPVYVAVYSHPDAVRAEPGISYVTRGALNHLGVLVDDLEAAERRVVAAGFLPHGHVRAEPGRKFLFDGPEGIEIEVVSHG